MLLLDKGDFLLIVYDFFHKLVLQLGLLAADQGSALFDLFVQI